jgi:hypothetical protein
MDELQQVGANNRSNFPNILKLIYSAKTNDEILLHPAAVRQNTY